MSYIKILFMVIKKLMHNICNRTKNIKTFLTIVIKNKLRRKHRNNVLCRVCVSNSYLITARARVDWALKGFYKTMCCLNIIYHRYNSDRVLLSETAFCWGSADFNCMKVSPFLEYYSNSNTFQTRKRFFILRTICLV